VVLGQCLGYTNRPEELDEQFAADIDDLLVGRRLPFLLIFKKVCVLQRKHVISIAIPSKTTTIQNMP
jgi:hypothetical protein